MNLTPVLEYIEQNLAGDVSLEALASRGGASPYHFHRVFRAAIGEAPKQYVRRLRLERAATRLKLSRRSVTDVAFAVGYDTHEGFTRAFGSHFGLSPQGFRAAQLDRDVPPRFAPRIERRPAQRVAFVRYVGPYDGSSEAFARLADWARSRGVLGTTMLGFYWDDQDITVAAHTRCDVALVVDDRFEPDGDVGVRTLAGGDYAVIEQAGDVPERRSFYEAAYRTWLPSIGRRPTWTPPFEEYSVTADGVDQSATRIHIPLRAR